MKHTVYLSPRTQVIVLESSAVCAQVVSGHVGSSTNTVLHGATQPGKATYAF